MWFCWQTVKLLSLLFARKALILVSKFISETFRTCLMISICVNCMLAVSISVIVCCGKITIYIWISQTFMRLFFVSSEVPGFLPFSFHTGRGASECSAIRRSIASMKSCAGFIIVSTSLSDTLYSQL